MYATGEIESFHVLQDKLDQRGIRFQSSQARHSLSSGRHIRPRKTTTADIGRESLVTLNGSMASEKGEAKRQGTPIRTLGEVPVTAHHRLLHG